MDDLKETWAEITRLLRQARDQLGPACVTVASITDETLRQSLEQFEEFLDHNELGLAWDELEGAAELIGASGDFWHLMAKAASLTQDPDKQRLAGNAAIADLERQQPKS